MPKVNQLLIIRHWIRLVRIINLVLSEGRFETGQSATFGQGDFNGDGVFNFDDVLVALANGTYNQDAAPGAVTNSVHSHLRTVYEEQTKSAAADVVLDNGVDHVVEVDMSDLTVLANDVASAIEGPLPRRAAAKQLTSLATGQTRDVIFAARAGEDVFEQLPRSGMLLE